MMFHRREAPPAYHSGPDPSIAAACGGLILQKYVRASTRPQIILESPNGRDLSQSELDGLATDFRRALRAANRADIAVNVVAGEPLGVGNAYVDVLHWFVPSADFLRDQVYDVLVACVVAFMRTRFLRKHGKTRPRVTIIYGPDGRPLKAVTIETPDGEPITIDPEALDGRTLPEIPPGA